MNREGNLGVGEPLGLAQRVKREELAQGFLARDQKRVVPGRQNILGEEKILKFFSPLFEENGE